jgi:hypothetical protein
MRQVAIRVVYFKRPFDQELCIKRVCLPESAIKASLQAN